MNYTKHKWGYELVWANTKHYFARILIVLENEKMPYIYHKKRTKTLLVLNGMMQLFVEGTSKIFNSGESLNVYPNVMHQVMAIKGNVTIIECGTTLEDDMVIISER